MKKHRIQSNASRRRRPLMAFVPMWKRPVHGSTWHSHELASLGLASFLFCDASVTAHR
jgi:hypothetical protein